MNTKKIKLTVILFLIVITGIWLYHMEKEDTEQMITAEVVAPTLEKVKIGYRGHLFYLPAYVAEAEDYYQKHGLDAELIKFESTNQLVDAIINGDIDAGIGGINSIVVLTVEQKVPGTLKIFNLGYFKENFDALLVRGDSDINDISDLEGKTISIFPGTAAMTWMNMLLEKEGLTGKVKVVQTSPSQQLNALASGSADAIFALEPLIAIGKDKGISRVLVDSPISNYFMTDMLFETSVFSSRFQSERPEAARKMIDAVDEAIEFINNNPDQAKEYYSEFTPVDDSLEAILTTPDYVPSYSIDITEFQEVADRFYDAGLIKEQVLVEEVFS